MSQFLTLTDLSHLAARKLPDTPDGRYPYQVQPKATGETDEASQALQSKLTLLVQNVKSVVKQGPISTDPLQDLVRDLPTVLCGVLIFTRNPFCKPLTIRTPSTTEKASSAKLCPRYARFLQPPP